MGTGTRRRAVWFGGIVLVLIAMALWWVARPPGGESSDGVVPATAPDEAAPARSSQRRVPERSPTPDDDLAQRGPIRITGTVREGETGEPIEGATVTFHLVARRDPAGATLREPASTGTTDLHGAYAAEIPADEVGSWHARVTAAGYAPEVVALVRGTDVELLRSRDIWIDVVDRRGDPVVGAEFARRTESGLAGAFVPTPGPLTLRATKNEHLLVRADGYPPQLVQAWSGDQRVRIVLYPGVPVAGRVVDGDSAPIEGALVELEVARSPAPRAVAAGKDGRFRFDSVPAREGVSVGAMFPGHDPASVSHVAGREDVELVLVRPGRVRCRVVDPNGVPVEGVAVHGFGHPTDAAGCTERDAPPGPLQLWARFGQIDATGHGAAFPRFAGRAEVRVRSGETVTTQIRLEEQSSTSVTVLALDAEGRPAASRRVFVVPGTSGITDGSGRAEVLALVRDGEPVTVRMMGGNPLHPAEARGVARDGATIEVRDRSATRLTVHLSGPDGALTEAQLEGASVRLLRRPRGALIATRSGAAFDLEVEDANFVALLASVDGVGATWLPFDARLLDSGRIDVTVRPTASIAVRPLEQTESTARELTVRVLRADAFPPWRTGTIYRSSVGCGAVHIPAGPVQVTVTVGGDMLLTETIDLQPGDRVVRRVGLGGARRVRGVVHDAAGNPIGGARIVPLHRRNAPAADVTGPDGRFVVDVPAAGVPLLVDRGGYAQETVRAGEIDLRVTLHRGGEVHLHWNAAIGGAASRTWVRDARTGQERQVSSLGSPPVPADPAAATVLIGRVPPGDHDFRVEIGPGVFVRGRVTVREGERVTVRLTR